MDHSLLYARLNMKQILLIFLLTFSCSSIAKWVEYSARANGDVYFYDNARVKEVGHQVSVWSRVRYKSSLMGSLSYQSYLQIDCAQYSEKVLQSTFFSDKDWTMPAMATNTSKKPKKAITKNSVTRQLADLLCKK